MIANLMSDTVKSAEIKIINKLFFKNLLSSGSPTIPLNNCQQDALKKFQNKLNQGTYSFEEVSCLCGGTDGYLIAKRDRYGLDCDTCLCKKCGLLRTSKRLVSNSLAKFYDEDYRPIYVGDDRVPDSFFLKQIERGKNIYQFLTSHIELSQNKTVFEVGCGAGGVLLPFKESGHATFGCDLGSNYLQRGRDEGLLLEHGDIDILAQFGKADVVILSHVLEHFENPILELRKIKDSLTDNGYLYIEVPGIFAIHKAYGKTINFLQNAHLYHFTLNTLTFVLAQAGFKLVWGDENICALFQKHKDVDVTSNPKEAGSILNYLYSVEIKNKLTFIRNIIRRIKGNILKPVKYILGDDVINYLKTITRN